MKHIFVLNPVAGKGRVESRILPQILEAVKKERVDFDLYRTTGIGDATRYVRECCQKNPEEELRFYAVGGDGTLNEVVNGAYGFHHAEIGFVPAGSGNDFARTFPNHNYFVDIERQIRGDAKHIDLIRYNGRFCINVLNIGLDCQVVVDMNRFKRIPMLKGPTAYLAGIASAFIKNSGYPMTVLLDEHNCIEGEMTLTAIGNGSFYGGGFKGMPKAKPDDGLLDVSIVRKISRMTFAKLIGIYKAGKHLDTPREFILYHQCKSLILRSHELMNVCADGEIEQAYELSVSIVPAGIRFCIPLGSE